MTQETAHEAAEQSLAKHLATALPLPQVAQQALEWHLKQSDIDKESLYQKLLDGLYLNNHSSFEAALKEALDGFNVTKKG